MVRYAHHSHSDRGSHVEAVVAPEEGAADVGQSLFEPPKYVGFGWRSAEEHTEFITAQACNERLRVEGAREPRCNLGQACIAGVVAEPIVHGLEAVQIYDRQCGSLAWLPGGGPGQLATKSLKRAPIGKAGQRVSVRQLPKFRPECSLMRDVLLGAEDPDRSSVSAANVRAETHPARSPSAGSNLSIEAEAAARSDRFCSRRLHLGAGGSHVHFDDGLALRGYITWKLEEVENTVSPGKPLGRQIAFPSTYSC
jgi:hypothetical protein